MKIIYEDQYSHLEVVKLVTVFIAYAFLFRCAQRGSTVTIAMLLLFSTRTAPVLQDTIVQMVLNMHMSSLVH